VPVGETFGFLGPNGAGKSTTIGMLCTLVKPSGGSAEVAGHDVVRERDEVRRNIGLVFQDTTLDGYLTAEENLRLHAELYGVPREVVGERMRQVLEMVELWERRGHIVNCDRIAIMDQGKIVVLDTPEALKESVGKDRVQLQTEDDDAAIVALRERFGIEAQIAEGVVTFGVQGGEAFVPRLFEDWDPAHPAIRSVSMSRPSLDDVFLAYTGSTIRDAEASSTDRARSMARMMSR
jgi:ABC-2 type transport system ATP-binding protein